MESIQEILEVRPTTSHTSLQYDERMENLGPIVEVLGGQINKKALHTIPFTLEMHLGLHYDLQPLPGEELDDLVSTKGHIFV